MTSQQRRDANGAARALGADDPAFTGECERFRVRGFDDEVSGVRYTGLTPPVRGMPLGAVCTGFVSLEGDGTLGESTLFNSLTPRRQINQPLFGLVVDGEPVTLTTTALPGVPAARIRQYFGHYPIVDVDYELDGPVQAEVCAWSPVLPGDLASSNTPAVFFRLTLTNAEDREVPVRAIINFAGPTGSESGHMGMRRDVLDDAERGLHGIALQAQQKGLFELRNAVSYSLSLLGEEGSDALTTGAGLASADWRRVASGLPQPTEYSLGTSLAVDRVLRAREEVSFEFMLTWWAPTWSGDGRASAPGLRYRHMYAARFADAREVAEQAAPQAASWERRVRSWQEALYRDQDLPPWLQDSLVNALHLIAKDGAWAQAGDPLPDWVRPEDGLFGMNESPEECPQFECIPNSLYGNIPLVYLFPELALSTLRGYVGYMTEDGEPPWIFGGVTGSTGGYDMAKPWPGYQVTLNGACFVDMVDRYWLRTGDAAVLDEFYPSVKLATEFTLGLNRREDGIVWMPDRPVSRPPSGMPMLPETEWLEAAEWRGMVAHVGGVHLAQLRMAERMARTVGDEAFAARCQEQFEVGQRALAEHLWLGSSYGKWVDTDTGERCDLVMANQADGHWMAEFHGIDGVFPPEHAAALLQTVVDTCVALTEHGAVNFTEPDGTPALDDRQTGYGPYNMWVVEVIMLGMTLMYGGHRDIGLEITRRIMHCVSSVSRLTWQMPCMVDGRSGEKTFGTDYYMPMMIWAVPAALAGEDLAGVCRADGIIGRILEATNPGVPAA